MMIRVALADDHAGVRTAIRCLLEHSSDIIVIGEAADGKTALQMAQELQPDVLVLDIAMPAMTGLEVMQQLTTINSPVKILVLSAYADYYRSDGLSGIGLAESAKYMEKKDAHKFLIDMVRELAADVSIPYVH